ncbi:unnamed protein product [Lactuca saligna]|uniref:DUF4283 domain-containing protein n=1 Tax=Lactuca saligna TaxID=75948 RepID=A0AA35YIJ0_LACSI|nr:unnamed protein product [Lactuca saligna]
MEAMFVARKLVDMYIAGMRDASGAFFTFVRFTETWTSRSVLVGEAKNFGTLCNFPSLLDLEGFDVVESKYLGGMKIIIKFKSDGTAKDEFNFEVAACNFGKVLVNTCPFWNRNDVSYGKLCILTNLRKWINDDMNAVFDGVACRIGIIEIDDVWTPFKSFSWESKEDSDVVFDDDVDGVSDTWIHGNMC